MKNAILAVIALLGVSAVAQATVTVPGTVVVTCDVLGTVGDHENTTIIYDYNNCRPVTSANVIGWEGDHEGRPVYGEVRTPVTAGQIKSDYWTYFPTAAAAQANCNVSDNVVYDYYYKAFRCQEASGVQGND